MLLPKSWDSAGFARVAVYVKKTFQYTQLHELEDDLVQSIWLKTPNRSTFVMATESSIGRSVSDQKIYLDRYLSQWEAATLHGNPPEPNKVHICCDMNIDMNNDRWLKPDYSLLPLSKCLQSACSVSNFSQLVSGITRTQYNSVRNMTDMSCIDHVYCNYKHRCSKITITSNGASDHDQLSYVRYSKNPPAPSRIIKKRLYKNFEKDGFIDDLKQVDWTDVYTCKDIDAAFWQKIKYAGMDLALVGDSL